MPIMVLITFSSWAAGGPARRMPIDAAPDANGNQVLTRHHNSEGHPVGPWMVDHVKGPKDRPELARYMPHFSTTTCRRGSTEEAMLDSEDSLVDEAPTVLPFVPRDRR